MSFTRQMDIESNGTSNDPNTGIITGSVIGGLFMITIGKYPFCLTGRTS